MAAYTVHFRGKVTAEPFVISRLTFDDLPGDLGYVIQREALLSQLAPSEGLQLA